jgi:hypothetical protein
MRQVTSRIMHSDAGREFRVQSSMFKVLKQVETLNLEL